MTRQSARRVANLTLAAAGLAAAYVVLTTPPLRRLALRTIRAYLGAGAPAFVAREARRAWLESRRSA